MALLTQEPTTTVHLILLGHLGARPHDVLNATNEDHRRCYQLRQDPEHECQYR
jgi:hypothetical protein